MTIKDEWYTFLTVSIERYRIENPKDTRTDTELLESFMEFLVGKGTIKKEDGKYALPAINDASHLNKLMSSYKN